MVYSMVEIMVVSIKDKNSPMAMLRGTHGQCSVTHGADDASLGSHQRRMITSLHVAIVGRGISKEGETSSLVAVATSEPMMITQAVVERCGRESTRTGTGASEQWTIYYGWREGGA